MGICLAGRAGLKRREIGKDGPREANLSNTRYKRYHIATEKIKSSCETTGVELCSSRQCLDRYSGSKVGRVIAAGALFGVSCGVPGFANWLASNPSQQHPRVWARRRP